MQSSRIFWGGLLVLLGVVLLGGNVFNFNAWQTVWMVMPLVLVGLGIWIYVRHPHSLLVSLLISLFGLLLFLGNLGLIDAHFFNLWPLLLIAVGLNVLLRENDTDSMEEDLEILTDTTMFAGSKKSVSSDKFKSAKLTTIFGGSELDLSRADLKEDVVIEAVVLFGEIKLRLPDNVRVTNDVTKIAAEVNDHRAGEKKSSGTKRNVMVKGVAIFGGMEIR